MTVKLNNNNALLHGLLKEQIGKLQRVLNTAATLLTGSHKYDHITPVLMQLHWLPIEQRIVYKIILVTFKALNGLAPQYIADMIAIINLQGVLDLLTLVYLMSLDLV